MKRGILSVLFALALVLGLSLVLAVPAGVSANGTPHTLAGGTIEVASIAPCTVLDEAAFDAEPETLVLDGVAFDAQSRSQVTIEGEVSGLVLGAGWVDTAYVEIGLRPEATTSARNAGVYLIAFNGASGTEIHLQDYTGGGRSGGVIVIPTQNSDFRYKITLRPSASIGGTATLEVWVGDVLQTTKPTLAYGYASTWQENVPGALDEDFSNAHLFYSIIADRRGVGGQTYSATVGEITIDDILYVGAGQQFTTIQAAIDFANPGDTINVAAGTYPEALNLKSKPLTIDGAGVDATIVDAHLFTGYAVQNFGDSTTIKDLTLIGTSSGSSSYGFKVSHVSNITFDSVKVENSYKTAFDLNTVTGATLTDIEAVNTIAGFGVMILDSNNITVNNVSTDNNTWGGVSVQTAGRASDNVNFTGTFDAQENVPLLLEKDPPTYYDITNVTIPGKFGYVDYAFRVGDDYQQWFYQETLNGAKAFANALMGSGYTYSDMTIYDIAEENYYVIEGMKIQDAVDAASGTTIYVDAGTYVESVYVWKPMTIVSEEVHAAIVDGRGGGWGRNTFTVIASNVTIEGFTIYGPDAADHNNDPAIMIGGLFPGDIYHLQVEYVTVRNCIIYANDYSGGPDFTTGSWVGIYIWKSSHNLIEGNKILGTYQDGIEIYDGYDDSQIAYIPGSTPAPGSDAGCKFEHPCSRTLAEHGALQTWDGVQLSPADYELISPSQYNQIINNDIQPGNKGIFVGSWDPATQITNNTGTVIEGNSFVLNAGKAAVTTGYTTGLITINQPGATRWSYEVYDAFNVVNVPDDNVCDSAWNATIQAAINAAREGGTINVAAETYDESVTINKNNLTLTGQVASQPAITGGLKFDTDLTGLTLQNFYVSGTVDPAKNSIVRMYGAITDLTIDKCVFDGENVADRMGFTGGQIEGDLTVTNSEFKDILGWAVLDTRSGSGGDGSAMGTVTFANNDIHDCNGSIVFRGLSTDRTELVDAYGNTWNNIGGNEGAQGEQWAALEVNRAITANVYDNTVNDVAQGEWGEGQAFQFWDIDTLRVHGNDITNNYQGIWIYGGGFAVPGGYISRNNIIGNNQYGISVDPTATGGPLKATDNWWGAKDGPSDGAGVTDPDTAKPAAGSGDKVSANVHFDPWIGAEVKESKTETITGGGTVDAKGEADTTVTVDGNATVTVAKYSDNPGSGFSGDTSKYIDVHVDDPSGIGAGGIEIRLYYTQAELDAAGLDELSLRLQWWDGTKWVICSDSGVDPTDIPGPPAYSGYMWAKITATSTPSLDDLSGAVFGGGGTPPPAAFSGGGGGGGGDTTPPIISAISSGGVTETAADISWRTSEISTSQVEYWASPSLLSPLDERLVTLHLVKLTGLTPGTTYHYMTMSKDRAGNLAVSPEYTFTTLGEAPAAAFTTSDLSISPTEVDIGESVTISVLVTNTGSASGSYEVTLKLNGVTKATEEVTVAAAQSESVSFTVSKNEAGSYSVDVNGLEGSFTVEEAAPLAPAASPEVKPPLNWPLVGGIIGGVIIVGLLVFFLARRRAY